MPALWDHTNSRRPRYALYILLLWWIRIDSCHHEIIILFRPHRRFKVLWWINSDYYYDESTVIIVIRRIIQKRHTLQGLYVALEVPHSCVYMYIHMCIHNINIYTYEFCMNSKVLNVALEAPHSPNATPLNMCPTNWRHPHGAPCPVPCEMITMNNSSVPGIPAFLSHTHYMQPHYH